MSCCYRGFLEKESDIPTEWNVQKDKWHCQFLSSLCEQEFYSDNKIAFKHDINVTITSASIISTKKKNVAKPNQKKEGDIINVVKEYPKNG